LIKGLIGKVGQLKNISFERGLIDEGKDNCPTRYSAYGTKP